MNTVFDNTSVMWTKINSVISYARTNCSLLTAGTAKTLSGMIAYASDNSKMRKRHAAYVGYVLSKILVGKTI